MRLEGEVAAGEQPEKIKMWGGQRATEMRDAGVLHPPPFLPPQRGLPDVHSEFTSFFL